MTSVPIKLTTHDMYYWDAELDYDGEINQLVEQLVDKHIQNAIREERQIVREAFKADGQAIRELVQAEIRNALEKERA